MFIWPDSCFYRIVTLVEWALLEPRILGTNQFLKWFAVAVSGVRNIRQERVS